MKLRISKRDGSTLVVTIIVVATLLVLLGVAVDYSTQISRVTQRSRKTARLEMRRQFRSPTPSRWIPKLWRSVAPLRPSSA